MARKVVLATAPQQESIETQRKNSIATEAKTAVAAAAVGVAGAAAAVMARYELIQGPLITDGRNRRNLISWAWTLCRILLAFQN